MDRFNLTNAQWEKMERFCLGKPTDPGRTRGNTPSVLAPSLATVPCRITQPRHWRPLSQGFDPPGCPTKALYRAVGALQIRRTCSNLNISSTYN